MQKKESFNPYTGEFGKIPPQKIEFEEYVLGAIIVEQQSLENIVTIIKPESFYKEVHQNIYRAIIDLYNESMPIDIITVSDNLKKKNLLDVIGGSYYIGVLASKVSSSYDILPYAMIIHECFIKRELLKLSQEIEKNAYDDNSDVLDILTQAEDKIFNITTNNTGKEPVSLINIVNNCAKQIEKVQKGEIMGVKTGYCQLDKIVHGWQNTDLIIIAGRPSMGKTAFLLHSALNNGVPSLIFSHEMSAHQLGNRAISQKMNFTGNDIKRGNIDWGVYEQKLNSLNLPVYVDDCSNRSVLEIKSITRKHIRKYGVKIIFVDYLQLMTDEGQNRNLEVGNITRKLKAVAKELNIPVVLLSQMSRSIETRSVKEPVLSDLRDSGNIEQDADVVIFVHRPGKYSKDADEREVQFIIAKHRNGELGVADYMFSGETMSYFDRDEFGNEYKERDVAF